MFGDWKEVEAQMIYVVTNDVRVTVGVVVRGVN